MLRWLPGIRRSVRIREMAAFASGDAPTRRRGLLIVFEGLDRSGKTTQAKRIVETLNEAGHKAVYSSFPDREAPRTGQIIHDHLTTKSSLFRKEAIHLIFSQNRWQKIDGLVELLNEGAIVIVDRYVASGVSYTLAKGLPKWFARETDVGLPQPDHVVYLNVSPEVAQQRGNYGDEAFERKDFQAKEVDANLMKDEVHGQIKKLIMEMIEENRPETVNRIKPDYFGSVTSNTDFSPKEFEFEAERGLLISFDGPNAGVLAQSFSDSSSAEIIDLQCSTDDLPSREKALTIAAHFWDQHEKILEKLSSGTNVVLLHYVPSSISAVLEVIGDKKWIAALFYGLPHPDLVVTTDPKMKGIAENNEWIVPSSEDEEVLLEEVFTRSRNRDLRNLGRFTDKNLRL
ncbi:hypothetical protein QR680_011017 [Steinernema hermaphroditum]|uniref:dTMP kinase n=1 Tax=Steinernema hermaphroditum TaxID=289476 RepID=A0AA39MC49_9BILA|nr:hypothetical protein QR680_011017 [Steinernema hermaphroditum]